MRMSSLSHSRKLTFCDAEEPDVSVYNPTTHLVDGISKYTYPLESKSAQIGGYKLSIVRRGDERPNLHTAKLHKSVARPWSPTASLSVDEHLLPTSRARSPG